VLLVARRARRANARLLVVDTDGINVWCSASKRQLCNDSVLAQVDRYDRAELTGARWLRLVFPKLAFAGIDLPALRHHKIRPIIGPVYAKDLPSYLATTPLEDRTHDAVAFALRPRLFAWLPGLIQSVTYVAAVVVGLAVIDTVRPVPIPVGIIALTAAIATAYPIAFPWLPGRRFAVKGVALGLVGSAALGGLALAGSITTTTLAAAIPFTVAMAILFALSFTGNSPISNYSRVRAEIARFLPVYAVLFVASVVALWVTRGPS